MRFAYIDSNGNEVPIPSVDALALRIELGAITEQTQLYDAQADQWGPAHTHEIFHTLVRSAGDDDQFVAPPPVAPPPVAPPVRPEPPVEPAAEAAEPVEPEPEPEPVPPAAADDSGIGELTLAEPVVPEEGEELTLDEDDDLGLTLADEQPEPEGMADGLGGLDLAPSPQPLEADPAPLPGFDDGNDEVDAAPSFDFGDGELEMESSFDTADDDDALDFSGGLDTGAPDLGADGDFGGGPPEPDFSGGMELETSMEFDAGGFGGGGDSGSLDLEAPMSDFSPDEPPTWMDPGEDESEGDVLDFSHVASSGDDEESAAEAPRDRRTPRNRPSPPRIRKQRNPLPLVLAVFVVAVAVGGYAAWPVLSARLAAGGGEDDGVVHIPEISAELMPEMRSVAEAALARSFQAVVDEWNPADRVPAPGSDWPGGAYLANASRYEGVESFWNGMSDLLGEARGISLAAFDAAVAAELSARGTEGADALAIRERADSGFVAAAPARMATFDQLAAVIDGAIRLHEFLVANEAGIEHVPASQAITNPVFEVDAATPEISAAMDDRLGDVVAALAALGFRDQVTSQGLREHVLSRLQATGIE